MLRAFAFFIALSACSPNTGVGWVEVGSDQQLASFARLPVVRTGQTVKLWTVGRYRQSAAAGLPTLTALVEIDCTGLRIRMLQRIATYPDGRELRADRTGAWRYLPAGSFSAQLEALACRGKGGGGRVFKSIDAAFAST
jgi:hypothetical protein